MKKLSVLVSTLLLTAASSAQAVTCGISCSASYRETVGSISMSADWQRIQDFKANCVDYLQGQLSSTSSSYTCQVRSTENAYGSGYGSDIASARVAAREDCSDGFRKDSDNLQVLVNYSNDYSCH